MLGLTSILRCYRLPLLIWRTGWLSQFCSEVYSKLVSSFTMASRQKYKK